MIVTHKILRHVNFKILRHMVTNSIVQNLKIDGIIKDDEL